MILKDNKHLGLWNITNFHYTKHLQYIYALSTKEMHHQSNNITHESLLVLIYFCTISTMYSSKEHFTHLTDDNFPIHKPKNISSLPRFWKEYYIQQLEWIQFFIRHFQENLTFKSIFKYLQQNTTLFISTDYSKDNRRSEGS